MNYQTAFHTSPPVYPSKVYCGKGNATDESKSKRNIMTGI